MWYREMALNNIAFCYGQIGDGANAKKYYLKTLEEFPGNPLATAGLALMRAAENNNQSQGENSK
jgi:Tfp pilus assembly protein PilF